VRKASSKCDTTYFSYPSLNFSAILRNILLFNCHIIWWCMITVYMMRTILNLFPHFQKQCHVLNLKEVEIGWIYLQIDVYLPWFSFSNLHIPGVDVKICKWHIIHQQTAPNQNCILYAFRVTVLIVEDGFCSTEGVWKFSVLQMSTCLPFAQNMHFGVKLSVFSPEHAFWCKTSVFFAPNIHFGVKLQVWFFKFMHLIGMNGKCSVVQS